ncbi:MAG: GTP pyrophosphokinase family protein [Ruminococcaceae bacterium]|nr:GTP pyrophosphokinase family protein [Oscillospiraceae bacterium]
MEHTEYKPYLKDITQISNEQKLEQIMRESAPFMRLMRYYKCAMMEIETKLNVLNEEYSLEHDRNPISSIKTRLKRLPSIVEKLERLNLPMSLETVERELCDIAGVRVICPFLDDVYTLAEAILKQDDVTLIRKKDYIKNPKGNGYRSLHLIVGIPIFLAKEKRMMKVEIQLRTIAMDCWASLEHQMRYKKDFYFSPEMEKELFECAEMSAVLDTRMDALRKEAFPEENQ